MWIKATLFFFVYLWHLFTVNADVCLDKDIFITSTFTYPSITLYQNLRNDFKTNRLQYGLRQNTETNIYADRNYWRLMMDTGQIKDIAYSSLEIPLSAEERTKYPELIMVPVMSGYVILYKLKT